MRDGDLQYLGEVYCNCSTDRRCNDPFDPLPLVALVTPLLNYVNKNNIRLSSGPLSLKYGARASIAAPLVYLSLALTETRPLVMRRTSSGAAGYDVTSNINCVAMNAAFVKHHFT